VPKNGQVQLRAHARAAFKFASITIGSINYAFAILLHIELAYLYWSATCGLKSLRRSVSRDPSAYTTVADDTALGQR
jgi:hypothetical protein